MAIAGGVAIGAGFDKEAFRNPPCVNSPAFFWMWNARLDRTVIEKQLDEMAANGLRNVCIHPFPRGFRPGKFQSGMDPDYLTPGYFEAFRTAIDHAAKLGMNAWLYDEGGWPSGGACGLVAAADGEGRFRNRFMGYGEEGKDRFGERIAEYAAGRRSYPSTLEPGATEAFIALTHQRYADALGEHIGRCVRFAFTDEPSYPGLNFSSEIGWTSDFAAVFRAKKGYDILPYVPRLAKLQREDLDDELARVRIDYLDVIGDLFVERYLDPIRAWCHAHGMKSSGHFNGEDVLNEGPFYGHGSLFRSLRATDIPGVDVIWRQLFPQSLAHPGERLPFPRYASSVAHQKGERHALSETFGIYGDSVTPGQMKWLVDYQMVRGIDLFVFGYYAMSNARQWMHLFEPHSGPVNPCWDFERPYFDYIARVSALLSQGRAATDVAVLYDERGFWAGGTYGEMAANAHRAVAAALDRRNCDYDFVDDEAIAAARVEDGRLVVGEMRYATIVLPTSKWVRKEAKARLDEFAKAGGRILTPEEIAAVRPTLGVRGNKAREIRVAKRICGDEELYFVVNECQHPDELELDFATDREIVRCDAESGACVATDAVGGRLKWIADGFGSALFLVGGKAERPARRNVAVATNELATGWTLRKTVSHAIGAEDFEIRPCADSEVPVELGDWRPVLGWHFSGKAVYRVEFETDRAGRAELDLGRVCWACAVRLNGKEVGRRFFGPYRFEAEVAKGRNVLEVTVANLLANALSDDAVRNDLGRKWPANPTYDARQRAFDRENNESGLFGPVRIISVR